MIVVYRTHTYLIPNLYTRTTNTLFQFMDWPGLFPSHHQEYPTSSFDLHRQIPNIMKHVVDITFRGGVEMEL